MDKMREEFEKWAESHAYNIKKSNSGLYYRSVSTAAAWRAWQASRAALVVELPEPMCRTMVGEFFDIDEVRGALTRAGIKYE